MEVQQSRCCHQENIGGGTWLGLVIIGSQGMQLWFPGCDLALNRPLLLGPSRIINTSSSWSSHRDMVVFQSNFFYLILTFWTIFNCNQTDKTSTAFLLQWHDFLLILLTEVKTSKAVVIIKVGLTFGADNFRSELQSFNFLCSYVLQGDGQLLGLAIEKLNGHHAGQFLLGHGLRRVGWPVWDCERHRTSATSVSQMLPSSRLENEPEFSCFAVFLFFFCLPATFHLSNTKRMWSLSRM